MSGCVVLAPFGSFVMDMEPLEAARLIAATLAGEEPELDGEVPGSFVALGPAYIAREALRHCCVLPRGSDLLVPRPNGQAAPTTR